MPSVADRSEAPTAIQTDLAAIFISLELSRSIWLVTSVSPGSGEKMSKHSVRAGDVAALLARFSELKHKALARTAKSFAIVAIQEAGLAGKITVVGTSLPSVSGKLIDSGAITLISFWDPALAGYAMNKVAVDKLEGKPVADGEDLGITGYNKIALKGHVIYGQAWVDVTKDNMKDYPF